MLIAKPQNWILRFDLQCRVCGKEFSLAFGYDDLTSRFRCKCGALNTVELDGLPPLDVKVSVQS